jgi:hypothetical protein
MRRASEPAESDQGAASPMQRVSTHRTTCVNPTPCRQDQVPSVILLAAAFHAWQASTRPGRRLLPRTISGSPAQLRAECRGPMEASVSCPRAAHDPLGQPAHRRRNSRRQCSLWAEEYERQLEIGALDREGANDRPNLEPFAGSAECPPFDLSGIRLQSRPSSDRAQPLTAAGPQTVLGNSDAPVNWAHPKRPQFAGPFGEWLKGFEPSTFCMASRTCGPDSDVEHPDAAASWRRRRDRCGRCPAIG